MSTSIARRGGGVLIAARKILNCSLLATILATVEHIFIKLSINSTLFIFGCFYILPCSEVNKYSDMCRIIESIACSYSNVKLCIFGDFNLPFLNWSPSNIGPTCTLYNLSPTKHHTIMSLISDTCNLVNLLQINTFTNIHNSMLDLVFCNSKDFSLNTTTELILPMDTYHSPLTVNIIMSNIDSSDNTQINSNSNVTIYDFKNANFAALNHYINRIDWHIVLNVSDGDLMLTIFYKHLFAAIDMFVPIKTISSFNYPHWFTPELKKPVIAKKVAHYNYKQSKNKNDYLIFSNLRLQCKLLSKACYNNYLHNAENSIINNVKFFWKHINSLRKNSQYPNEMYFEDECSSIDVDICNLFAKFFESVYTASNV